MTLEEYLHQKKIDAAAFRAAETAQWTEWAHLFEQVHPNSFTMQKLYLLNKIRRKYPWKGPVVLSPLPPVNEKKPVIKPKMG